MSQLHIKTRDFMVSREEFPIYRTGDSAPLMTGNLPDDLEPYYQSEEYFSHRENSDSFMGRLYMQVRKYNVRRKVRLINQLMPQAGRLLEIGSGQGDFLLAAEHSGWKTYGVEPNDSARQSCLEKGLNVEPRLSLLPYEMVDSVAFWHVLEHIPDLDDILRTVSARIRPGGYLILALPNYKSWDSQHYGRYWAAYDVPRHVWHFSPDVIPGFFKGFGFSLVRTRPMWPDAFYVSWLSEKYAGHKLAPVRGLAAGFYSNLRACYTGQYSSLIYFLQKSGE